MNRSRILSLLVLFAALGPAASHPQDVPAAARATSQAVEITSRLKATVVGGGQANLTVVGVATHTQTGLTVIFNAKQLIAVDPGDIGPLTITLNPRQKSDGTLSSAKFPAVHRQNFYLLIRSERLGTLISDAPVTLSARIESSPPNTTYKSVGGAVKFYKEGDSRKKPAFIIQQVTSDVKPAASTAVDIKSRVAATVGDKRVELQLAGTAVHVLGGRSVIFTAKRLTAVNPGDIGPLTFTLNPRRPSLGTLSSATFPARHEQNFFLQIQSERLGTLVSDAPLVVAAQIEKSPPAATYKSTGKPVQFYKQGDSGRKPVLTIETVESDVTPATAKP
ncbi:MAG TPA: hypothetical protein VGX68_23215 [Thermoanaerobaculia bacterium]|jgi:hypothetical protein|nr:hypothetical protein [Thermoanaerobaculia bacterium]